MKYVWLKPDYSFTQSWDEDLIPIREELIEYANKKGWRLIKFECVNDKKFEFTDCMKMR